MSNKDKKNEKKDNKKTIFIVVGIVLLLIILFLIWFFNRKFDVTFNYNNGTENYVVKVKYNNVIDSKDVKDKKDLGDKFINWYLVIDTKDGKDVLEKEAFDFKTKIKENTKLKAVYEGIKTITINFDSKGGSKVNSITMNEGEKLTLPNNPTYSGYIFDGWYDKDDKKVENERVFTESTTLIAKWSKVTTTTTKKATTKKQTTKAAEESISLSLNRNVIHRNGNSTATAKATVKNSKGNVTYSLEGVKNGCITINSSTGAIKAANFGSCSGGLNATVKATSKTGKTATAKITLENDLSLSFNNKWYSKNDRISDITASQYTVIANIEVSWSVGCGGYDSKCKYVGKKTTSPSAFYGNFEIKPNPNDTESMKSAVKVTAKTKAGQSISLVLTPKVN